MKKYIIGCLLMIYLTIAGSAVIAQDGTLVQGGSDTDLRDYIARLLNPSGIDLPLSVHVAQIPALPFEFPIPEDVRIIGSVERSDNQSLSYEILMEGSKPLDVLAFYTAIFSSNGWQVIRHEDISPGGFSPSEQTTGRFCMENQEFSLQVDSVVVETGKNLITAMIVSPAQFYHCDISPAENTDNPYTVLQGVSLGVPEGVAVMNNTGDGLSYYSHSSNSAGLGAVLESELPLSEVAAGYHEQLAALGWQAVTAESGTHFAISTWTFTDNNGKLWHGTLMLTATHHSGISNALLYIED